ncbi:MAG: hypothetical protein NT066_04640 [Candidatus Omnitrophica bacterium]|nr:hypothetical protein [Candidatus Omnitrophota bacterium]
MKIKIIFVLSLFLISPLPLLAQEHYKHKEDSASKRDIAVQKALEATERGIAIEETLREITIELTLEYGFAAGGKQGFELLDSQGRLASKLTYPTKGEMVIVKGEVGFWPKVFLGGRYGNSNFKKRICSDEDWNMYDPFWPYGSDAYVDYQISKQMSKSKVEFFDINLYYRLLDIDEEELNQRNLFRKEDSKLFDYLVIDNLALDIFIGYQYQKSRSRMLDPTIEILRSDEGTEYSAVGLPVDIGLDSFYEIEYRGPRLGLRAIGSKGKLTTKVGFAYAYLQTKAEGWWNLRNLSFWQKGKGGSGVDIELETSYAFNPHLSLGMGFNFIYRHQEKLKMYAEEEGTPWWDGYQDRIRNANSSIYFPSALLKVIW